MKSTTSASASAVRQVVRSTNVPGTYSLVDHSLFRAFNKGAVAQLIVEGTSGNDLYSGQQAELAYTPAPRTGAANGAAMAARTPGELGKATFDRVCAGCHQAEGQGMPGAFPPLAKSDYLASASKDRCPTASPIPITVPKKPRLGTTHSIMRVSE